MKRFTNKLPHNERFICLFSGGKDSHLALSIAGQQGRATALVTITNGLNNNNHNIDYIKEQAKKIDLPLDICIGDPKNPALIYHIVKKLRKYGKSNVNYLVTGNISNKRDIKQNQEIADMAGMTLCCPLWNMEQEKILDECEKRKIKSSIIFVNHPNISDDWIGKTYDRKAFNYFKSININPLGEDCEFHTTVTDCDIYIK